MRIQEHPILGTYQQGALVSFTLMESPYRDMQANPLAMALKNAG